MASDVVANTSNSIRENLISTAVKFLTNPNIQKCTLESKQKFLRSKGLTDLEIQAAIEKCAEIIDVPSLASDLMLFQKSRRNWFRDNLLPFVVYGGCLYGLYWFYKVYIRRLIYVEEPRKKTTTECLEDLKKSLDILNSNISALRTEVLSSSHSHSTSGIRTQLDCLKADIASVKGILLNRNQFPSVKTRSETHSIPAWQRQAEEATSTDAATETSPSKHRPRSQRSESGGSNSSEGEHATKNSDSSLEIIT